MKIETRTKYNLGDRVQIRIGKSDRYLKSKIEAMVVKITTAGVKKFYDVKNGSEVVRVKEDVVEKES